MATRPNTLALAVMTLYAGGSSADTADTSIFSLSSFGTVGIVHSGEKKADFTTSIFKPNGAGHSRNWSADVDSLIGAQLTATFTPQLSAVVQVISEQRYDNSYRPFVEWANIKYQFTPDFNARIGRTVLPTFLVSDTRKVGYTLPWARAPMEVYSLMPISSSDGIDGSYRFHIDEITDTVQAHYGQTDSRQPDGAGKALTRNFWGVTNTTEFGVLTTRITFMKADLTLEQFNSLFDTFREFGAEGIAIADRYDSDDTPVEFFGVGASYDPGDWFVMSEWGRLDSRSGLGRTSAWYISGGYRIEAFTPYVTYARSKTETEVSSPGLTTSALPPELAGAAAQLNGALNSVLGSNEGQQTLSLGVRWDFTKNMDAKLQYDHTRFKGNSVGPLINPQPDFEPGGSFNVISLAVDFVF
ncbi:porin [Pseudomonas brassicacearum]|uniref:porin n=1 Tax=Pseudomonas brassicacearum TaxID=930166 RepID=UPI00069E7AB3|nr:porin [Pseudomonas brassicacearum]